jgi:hypothetical protein
MVDLGQGVGDDLTGARPNGCSEAQRLTVNGATEGEEHGESVSSLTGAWMAVWRPGDGGEEEAVEALCAGDTWVWREENEDGERCGGGR